MSLSPSKQRTLSVNNTVIAFPTPIHQTCYENMEQFNGELSERILAMQEKSPSESYSNLGGWQGDAQLLDKLGEPYSSRLKNMIAENIQMVLNVLLEEYEKRPIPAAVVAWANVNQRGDSNQSHIHPGAQWSGVYYVSTEIEAGGELVFTDPRSAALMSVHPLNPFNTAHAYTIRPVPGMIVVFPSFLYHAVLPYKGNSPRVSIAFNVL